jgi:hypothetical protein
MFLSLGLLVGLWAVVLQLAHAWLAQHVVAQLCEDLRSLKTANIERHELGIKFRVGGY